MNESGKSGPILAGLKRLRKLKGLSQLRFGDSIGVDSKCISRYETEAIVPRLAYLRAMCRVLGCQLWQLFFDPEQPDLAA